VSGLVLDLELPLTDAYAQQATKGLLVRVNEDGSPYTGEASDASQGAGVTTKPAVNAPKAQWVGWAVHEGADVDDAEAMTKQDLIEKYGA
jgi:hypothetical protein